MTASGLKTVSPANGKINVVTSSGLKTVSLIPTTYTFKGKGWGHAVGMSQEEPRAWRMPDLPMKRY